MDIEALLEEEERITDEAVNEVLTVMASYENMEKVAVETIEKFIQAEVDRLNKVKGIYLEDKKACKLYGDTEGYKYQQECQDLWNWAVNEVYGKMDEWRASLDHIPTQEEFLNELYSHAYTVTYPEEK